MNTDFDDKLMADAGKLETGIPPGRDLWPGIEASINERRRRQRTPYLLQAAAVVLLVGASSAVTYMMTKTDAPVSPTAGNGNLVLKQASFGGAFQLSTGYKVARNDLRAQLDTRLALLSPESRSDIEKNLEIIRDAIAEINTALEQSPDNVLLQEMLFDTYREELAVMRNVGSLTQNVMSRNDI